MHDLWLTGRIRLNLVKHLRIKISERSYTQRFDDSMSSFSSEERMMTWSHGNVV